MASARGGRWPPADVGRAGGAMARHAGRRAGAGRQAGRQASPRGTARACAPADGGRAVARWVVGGWHGRRRLIRLSMIGTASSAVDRDSLACVRCSPSRAPHGLAAAQDDSSRTRHGTRGGATAAAVAAAARGSERGCKAGARPVAALRDLKAVIAGSGRTVTLSVRLQHHSKLESSRRYHRDQIKRLLILLLLLTLSLPRSLLRAPGGSGGGSSTRRKRLGGRQEASTTTQSSKRAFRRGAFGGCFRVSAATGACNSPHSWSGPHSTQSTFCPPFAAALRDGTMKAQT